MKQNALKYWIHCLVPHGLFLSFIILLLEKIWKGYFILSFQKLFLLLLSSTSRFLYRILHGNRWLSRNFVLYLWFLEDTLELERYHTAGPSGS